ncbi:MAG: transcription-repair coupling factor [Acidobacteriota bacterium]
MTLSLRLQELLRSVLASGAFAPAAKPGLAAPLTVSGLTPAARSLWIAGAAARDPRHETVVVIVASDRDVEQTVGDVRFFLGGLEGASLDELDDTVLPFPSQEIDPYRGLRPHMSIASARARALHALATDRARVVVASATALLPRVNGPEALTSLALDLRPGTDIDTMQLASILVDAGFTREDPVDQHGEFCVRGGVVDIFPAGDDQPARLEFVGDTIESIRRYSPESQRSLALVDRLRVLPLTDAPITPALERDYSGVTPGGERDDSGNTPALERGCSLFDYLRGNRRPVFIVCEPDEVRDRAEEFLVHVADSYAAATSHPRRDSGLGIRDSSETRLDRRARDTAGLTRGVYPDPEDILVSWNEVEQQLRHASRLEGLGIGALVLNPESSPNPESPIPNPRPVHIHCQPSLSFHGRLADWIGEVQTAKARGDVILFAAATPGRAERIVEVLADYGLRGVQIDHAAETLGASVLVTTGHLSRGFRLPDAALQIYAEADLFEEERRGAERRRGAARAFLSDLRDLKVGDLVVHVDHGIGEFVGLKKLAVKPLVWGESVSRRPRASVFGDASADRRSLGGSWSAPGPGDPGVTPAAIGADQEFLELRYHGGDKLFVPVSRLDLVQKYSGGTRPALDRLGGTTWEKAKTRVKKAMREMAEELLKLYAARKAIGGHAFSPDTHWQEEFEGAFPFELTPDQQTAIEDIKNDMESAVPMDRLLCGDVGYGKTEVAMRAAFKAVMEGKQVAFLAPTTVLAFQHVKTLGERFGGFPIRIDLISRFRAKPEIAQTLSDLAGGKVDIIVGTHRLLSKDVVFKDLGLLVVDEEQRFGVAHKEKIKQLRRKVDVLTMSATPIPRTLNMSLVGIRDMSIIETPPKDRLAIQTNVIKFDQGVIARAVRNELARGGQVYFVHNRVESIYSIGNLLARLVPEARIVVGHGQMGEHQLEQAMIDFVGRKYDVLLATTIVENGLDIPNANTLIINRADKFGLAQLYQLRGRVGRSDRPAYAYLLIPPEVSLSPVAKKRLAAIREFSDLGSGFRVAALDLEIRGAGNLLGGEQSGHIDAVGFEMYMKLLEQAVRELKGEEVEDEARATVNLGIDIRIDETYVPDMAQRLVVYRRIAAARSEAGLDEVLAEVRDRYGSPPDSVLNLAEYGRIRVLADRIGLDSIERQGRIALLRFREDGGSSRVPDPQRILAVINRRADVRLVPPSALRLDLRADLDAFHVRHAHGTAQASQQKTRFEPGQRPGHSGGTRAPARTEAAPRLPTPDSRIPTSTSWWTERATTGSVQPGFSKEELTKAGPEDPRAAGGLFERLGDLLRDLSG